MSKNVGRCDAFLRVAGGLMLISLGIMKRKGCLTVLGSLKVATGVTRYCPVMHMCNLSTMCDEELLEDFLTDDMYYDECCEEFNYNELPYEELENHETAPANKEEK